MSFSNKNKLDSQGKKLAKKLNKWAGKGSGSETNEEDAKSLFGSDQDSEEEKVDAKQKAVA